MVLEPSPLPFKVFFELQNSGFSGIPENTKILVLQQLATFGQNFGRVGSRREQNFGKNPANRTC